MQEIVSVNNELVKKYAKLKQKKFRMLENLFLIEGEKCVKDAVLSDIKIADIFILKNKIEKFNYKDAILVDEKVMKKIADTESFPEIIAIAQIPQKKIDFQKCYKIAVFENIKDAGNLGTIIRSACAFSLDAIILTGDCIDIFNPKVIRSSVGNIFKIPVLKMDSHELVKSLSDFTLYSTVVQGGNNLEHINFAKKSAILFGSEADGLSNSLKNIASEHITLKMAKNVESLNLSVSASIIFYKLNN